MLISSGKLLQNLKPLSKNNLIVKASICHKSELPPRPPVKFPYEKIPYNSLTMWLDPLTKRKFNDNSLIVQIEGNVASGKHEFAHQLAEQLDMFVLPDVSIEDYYVNEHGFDYRALNPLLPERLRMCDMEMFHENPSRHSVIHMQWYFFKLRMLQYIKALRHLFNTGQGVILVRSAYTEHVFNEAMQKLGWLPKGYLRGDGVQFYDWKNRQDYLRNISLGQFLKPHLTIYLDAPVDTCLNRIRSSNDPMISQSKALTPEFLQAIKESYEDVMLHRTEFYGHLVTLEHPDKKTDCEMDEVLDQLYALDFEYSERDWRFKDWLVDYEYSWWYSQRHRFTSKQCLMNFFDMIDESWMDIAGLGDSIDNVDLTLRDALYQSHVEEVGWRYSKDKDPQVNNPFKILFNFETLDKKLDRAFKSDFV